MKTKTATLSAYVPFGTSYRGITAYYRGNVVVDQITFTQWDSEAIVLDKLKAKGFTHYKYSGQSKGMKIKPKE